MNRILTLTALLAVCASTSALIAQEPCATCSAGTGAVCHGGCGLAANHSGGLLQFCGKHGMKAKGDVWAQQAAATRPWHGQYYYLPYGQPTALVVPPTAIMHQNYSWGVSQNTMMPTYHQFGPSAIPSSGGAFLATPPWPSHTDQFGVYPVRAPW